MKHKPKNRKPAPAQPTPVAQPSAGGHISGETRTDYHKAYRLAHLNELRAANRIYSAAHRKEKQEYDREYRAENLERNRETQRIWRENNLEHKRAVGRSYSIAKRVKIQSYKARYQKQNGERLRQRARDYYRAHKVQFLGYSRKRKAIKRSASIGNTATIYRWESRWKLSKLVRCFWCNEMFSPSKCHADHIVALAKGGPHSIENLCISCAGCNSSKKASQIAEWNRRITEPILL